MLVTASSFASLFRTNWMVVKVKLNKRSTNSFYFPGIKDTACVLLHGFTGSPAEMRPLGDHLNKKGYTVYAPPLAGHEETVEKLANTSEEEILNKANNSLNEMIKFRKKVVIGLSMGGLIAGLLAHKEKEIDGLILLCVPVYLAAKKVYMAKFFSWLMPFVERKFIDNYPLPVSGYKKMPLKGISELLKIKKKFISVLPEIKVPTMIVQGQLDKTVRPESSDFIYQNIGSKVKDHIKLEKSRHLVTIDIERKEVFKRIDDFIFRYIENKD